MGYLYWNTGLEISKTLLGKYILKKKVDKNSDAVGYVLNDTAYEIVNRIDGTKTYEEVLKELSIFYNEKHDIVSKHMDALFASLKDFGIELEHSSYPIRDPNAILQNDYIMPVVASLEITSHCNLRCRHCYGEYGNENRRVHMSISDIKSIIDDMDEAGVKIVELTGGDISVHPNLFEVINYALEKNFTQISLLTNGLVLEQKVKDLIINHPNKFVVQIDLHSMDSEYNSWFTQRTIDVGILQKNIKYFIENDVRVRVAMIVTNKNIDDIYPVAQWSFLNGAYSLGISPVIKIGRAISYEDELIITDIEKLIQFENTLEDINKKYPNFISINDEGLMRQRNCGCLTSHIVIDSFGDIKLCTMDNLEYARTSIGNVLRKSIKDIYKENNSIINEFFELKAPNSSSEYCVSCENLEFCEKCILRGLIKASEDVEKCGWYKNSVSDLLKDMLAI